MFISLMTGENHQVSLVRLLVLFRKIVLQFCVTVLSVATVCYNAVCSYCML